jgi:hypothetical protein
MRDASNRATKAFYPALLMSDLIFSGKSSKMRCKAPNGHRPLWPIPVFLGAGPGLADCRCVDNRHR